ncbi:MAG TPA: AAA family ATPase, partial [Actinomycetota bacterium]|nr:AAA family ATPase [Actinomycetota bacterium]
MTVPTPAGKSPNPLVGRGPQVAELLLALAGAVKGTGQIVLIEGEAGIGKTVLLDAALRSARSLGFGCFGGAAEELERHRPFGALSDALGLGRRARISAGPESMAGQRATERRSQLATLIRGDRDPLPAERAEAGSRGQGPGDPLSPGTSQAEYAIVDGLIDYVEQLCAASPLALAVDDLHWADPSTLVAIGRLAREIRGLPCVLMAALRPLPRTPRLEALKTELASLP